MQEIFTGWTTLEATPETDRKLRKEFFKKGRKARLEGKPPSSFGKQSVGSKIHTFWLEGYNSLTDEQVEVIRSLKRARSDRASFDE